LFHNNQQLDREAQSGVGFFSIWHLSRQINQKFIREGGIN